LNDPSTQPIAQATAQQTSTMDMTALEDKIEAVEKQLHAALGAT
jgi:hypothetical protein